MYNVSDYYGESFKPLVGIVEQVVDEVYVRVRVFGIHPIDRTKVTTEQLPLAVVVYPVTGGQAGSGSISHNLAVDSWVVGTWVDYPLCQQLLITGAIQGTDYSMSTYRSQGGEFVGQGSESADGGDGTGGVDTGATTNIPGNSNVQKTYNYVTTKIMAEGSGVDTHIHASAICGSLMLESGVNINPASLNSIGAWGICQWLGARRAKLFARYGRTRRLDQQLDFMWWELNNTHRRMKSMWLAATNLPDAVAAMSYFEGAEDIIGGKLHRNHSVYKGRLKYAYQVYNSIKQTGVAETQSKNAATGEKV